MRILIVEDNAVTADSLAELLKDSGVECLTALNADAALSRLELDSRFDAIVTDNFMPNMTGMEFAKCIRASGVVAPVILITAAADRDVADLRLELDAVPPTALMRKPFMAGELLALLRSMT